MKLTGLEKTISIIFCCVVYGALQLLSKFIGFWPTAVIVITASIFLFIHTDRDRKQNPEKWAKLDKEKKEKEIAANKKAALDEEKNRPKEASKYFEEYLSATKTVPKSKWILMTREEKAEVFRKREQMKDKFFQLPFQTRELIKSRYNIDTSFPNI